MVPGMSNQTLNSAIGQYSALTRALHFHLNGVRSVGLFCKYQFQVSKEFFSWSLAEAFLLLYPRSRRPAIGKALLFLLRVVLSTRSHYPRVLYTMDNLAITVSASAES